MKDQILAALNAGDARAALVLARQWTAQSPSDEGWLCEALALQKLGEGNEALAALDRAIALAPERADLHVLRGQLELASGKSDKAAAALQQAIALDPNQLSSYQLLGHLALASGQLAQAKEHLARALRVDAEHPQTMLLEAQVAEAGGQPERVLPLLTRAVERAPKDTLAQTSLGLAFLRRGHFAFAATALRNALLLKPEAEACRRALVFALEQQGQRAEAIAVLEEPATPRALDILRAQLLVQAGRLDDALQVADKILQDSPEHPAAVDMVVKTLVARGDVEMAGRLLDGLLQRAPTSALLWNARLGVAVNAAQIDEILGYWAERAANDPALWEAQALWAAQRGDVATAESLAERAGEANPELSRAQGLRIRARMARDPASALALIDNLLENTVSLSRTVLHGWRAMALDLLDRCDDAVRAWSMAWATTPAGLPFLPNPTPASAAKPPSAPLVGTLLWGLPGSGVEAVVQWGRGLRQPVLTADRMVSDARGDGFGALRPGPDEPECGTAERWVAAIRRQGVETGDVIDWLPHWDGWTAQTLAGTQLLAVLRDPRDMLLAWMAGNAPTNYRFPSAQLAAEWMAQCLEPLVQATAATDAKVTLFKLDDLATQEPELRARFAAAIGVAEDTLAVREPMAIGLPAGRWRAYQPALGPAFDRLRDIAVRLGYSAD